MKYYHRMNIITLLFRNKFIMSYLYFPRNSEFKYIEKLQYSLHSIIKIVYEFLEYSIPRAQDEINLIYINMSDGCIITRYFKKVLLNV